MERIERFLDGSLSAEDAGRLLDLLREDPAFRAEFVSQLRTHGLLSAAIGPDPKLADVVMVAIPTGPRALESKVMEGIRRRSRRPLWIAAAAATIAAIAFLALRPAGVRTLDDGSILELAEGAEIEEIGNERVVLRRGALLARVKPRTSGPLVFVTPHAEARVLGTTLRLKVDVDTRLDVEEGKVELKNRAGRAAVVEAGQTAWATEVELTPPGWTNVTEGLGGEAWGYSGVTWVAPVPGKDELLAGVSEAWLWSSADGGASWRQLGGAFKNRPFEIHFDPRNARTFWASGIYGPGLMKTSDGGASFEKLGALDHVEGFGVAGDTLLAVTHRGEGNLHRSRDGGRSWEKLPTPEGRATAMDPLVLDETSFLMSAEGMKLPALFRSVDGGESWTSVATHATAGPALVASDGAIYWGCRSGLIKSVDRGATWTELRGPVRSTPIELPGGALVGAGERQLFRSLDGGARWDKLGPPLPIVPSRVVRGLGHPAVAYLPARRAYFVWRSTDSQVPDALFRWIETPR